MADSNVVGLTNATSVADADTTYLQQGGADREAAMSLVKAYVLGTPVSVVGNATAGAQIRLPEDTDNGSNYVALKAPDTLSANLTLTLPSADGSSGHVLQTNGSGVLSFAAPSGGASVPLTLASGTITDPSTALTITQTWNDAADTFAAASIDITNTASANGSILLRGRVPAANNAGFEFTHKNPGDSASLKLKDIYGGSGEIAQGGNIFGFAANSKYWVTIDGNGGGSGWGVYLASDTPLGWGSSAAGGSVVSVRDISLHRIGAGVLGVRAAATSNGAALNFIEQTAPSAPTTDQVVIYAEDNGSGKTRLMARFATGAAQQLAIEP